MMRTPIRSFSTAAAALALLLAVAPIRSQELAQDRGAAGAWQKLLKVTTTASLMHTTAHPDDEQGGMLAYMSRGQGVRTTLLTLNRGESGDNAIGPALFDALGLIRAEELAVANRYYGVDEQYFTALADYGYSKRLDEAIEQWGREHVLREMVRVIRTERPWVIVSRWQGNQRDGHGQHQAAGLLSQEAYKAAGDPAQFPEQIAAGLRPWLAKKLYMGGAREQEAWHVRVNTGTYDPLIGDTYANFARLGLSFQRSQNSGRYVPQTGLAPAFFVRLAGTNEAAAREESFFDGIDTTWPGLARALGRPEHAGLTASLAAVDAAVKEARQAFSLTDPSGAAPALARGLTALRAARAGVTGDAELAHVLALKDPQFVDALAAALGLEVSAIAEPAGTARGGQVSPFAPAPTLEPLVPGQRFDVKVGIANHGKLAVTRRTARVETAGGRAVTAPERMATELGAGGSFEEVFTATLPAEAEPTYPPVSRGSIAESRYTVRGAATRAPATLTMGLRFGGVDFELSPVIRRRENQQPYGYVLRELAVVPELSVAVSPRQAMLPARAPGRTLTVTVDVTNNQPAPAQASVQLQVPSGWRASPASVPLDLAAGGARVQATFTVTPPAVAPGSYPMTASVTSGGKTFREGYDVLAHRDLETRYYYRPSTLNVAVVDVRIAPDLRVGYVMGVGDELPAALGQLGARVELLDAAALATSPLDRFQAIVLGTRAYAVRADLRANNARLLDYAKNGGNLIVLYNTQELDPAAQAPFPGKLPGSAEEVAEERAAVTILAPSHPVFTSPNRITPADFDGWVEQRGSKFWSEWDAAYTPLLETHDRGQAPQRGGWLYAPYGKGHYSYVAYAFHRQLPYGVPGAYRLMANLLSLGRAQ